MGNDRLFSPVASALSIQEQYHQDVKNKLIAFGLNDAESQTITTDIFAKDNIYFSLNRPYKRLPESFSTFCLQNKLHSRIPRMLTYIDKQKLYRHQEHAIQSILAEKTTIISTGTGSGKTESFLIPILHYCLQQTEHQQAGIKAVILYPLNALANDQIRRIVAAVKNTNIRVGCFVGSTPQNKKRTSDDQPEECISRQEMIENPPDILITNYIMLDRLITKPKTRSMFSASKESLKYLVVDEIHYFRGTKGANLSLLLRRLRTFCQNKLVQIGASGTLRQGGGYFPNQAKTQIEEFTRLIFGQEAVGTDGIQPIEPIFEEEPDVSLNSLDPLPPAERVSGLTLMETLDRKQAILLCQQLFGAEAFTTYKQQYKSEKVAIRAFAGYHLMLKSPFVKAMRIKLTEKACTFQEMRDLFCQLYKDTYGHEPADAKSVVEAYWSLIDYLNEGCAGASIPLPQVLDYRLHLILNDVSEDLTRCLQCGRYHDGRCLRCRYCNNGLLFKVSKQHPDQCIAYLLKNALYRKRIAEKQVFTVLVRFHQTSESTEENPIFTLEEDTDLANEECYQLRPASAQSQPLVTITLAQNPQALETLPISNPHVYWQNVLKIIDGLVTHQKTRISDKLLGFIDNREKASSLKLRLNDDFAERALMTWATLQWQDNKRISLPEAFELLQNELPHPVKNEDDQNARDVILTEILQEMPFWFQRMLMYLAEDAQNQTNDWQISIDKDLPLSNDERELLEKIMLPAKAIDKTSFEAINYASLKHFYLDMYRVETQYGVGARSFTEKGFQITSLGEQGIRYKDMITSIGVEKIAALLQDLTTRDIITQKKTRDEAPFYQIQPQHIFLEMTGPQKEEKERDEWHSAFALVECHTADHTEERRADIERRFRNNQIQALICTPTLEMGVDIGNLQSVLMIGFPPSPANYAQRAGRAGRGKKHQATIVTLSASDDAHDAYYYAIPTKMLDGMITPPQFTFNNFSLLAAHCYAYIVAGTTDSTLRAKLVNIRSALQEFLAHDDLNLVEMLETERRMQFAQYLIDDAKNIVARIEALGIHDITLENCYRSGIFPDYGFRSDGLPLLDKSKTSRKEAQDESLTSREPESASAKLAPGRIVFCGGRAVQIHEEQPSASYQEATDPNGRNFRLPRYVLAKTDEPTQIEKWRDPNKLYCITHTLDTKQPLEALPITGPLYCQVYLVPESILYFINEGEMQPDAYQPQPLQDSHGRYRFGLKVEREGLLVRFSNIILSANMKANFLAVLLRAIPDYCNLDDTELRVTQNITVAPTSEEGKTLADFFIYGQDKSGLVPFTSIFENLNDVLEKALSKLRSCSCNGTGCYLCLFSLNSHMLTGRISQEGAIAFLAAFLKEERLKPHIEQKPTYSDCADIVLTIKTKGENWFFHIHDVKQKKYQEYSIAKTQERNSTLYRELSQILRKYWLMGARSLHICANEEYVRNQLRGEYEVKKGREEFFALWLERSRWLNWQVTKEE
jgi:superfamily II DNA or RNA helicase